MNIRTLLAIYSRFHRISICCHPLGLTFWVCSYIWIISFLCLTFCPTMFEAVVLLIFCFFSGLSFSFSFSPFWRKEICVWHPFFLFYFSQYFLFILCIVLFATTIIFVFSFLVFFILFFLLSLGMASKKCCFSMLQK